MPGRLEGPRYDVSMLGTVFINTSATYCSRFGLGSVSLYHSLSRQQQAAAVQVPVVSTAAKAKSSRTLGVYKHLLYCCSAIYYQQTRLTSCATLPWDLLFCVRVLSHATLPWDLLFCVRVLSHHVPGDRVYVCCIYCGLAAKRNPQLSTTADVLFPLRYNIAAGLLVLVLCIAGAGAGAFIKARNEEKRAPSPRRPLHSIVLTAEGRQASAPAAAEL